MFLRNTLIEYYGMGRMPFAHFHLPQSVRADFMQDLVTQRSMLNKVKQTVSGMLMVR